MLLPTKGIGLKDTLASGENVVYQEQHSGTSSQIPVETLEIGTMKFIVIRYLIG